MSTPKKPGDGAASSGGSISMKPLADMVLPRRADDFMREMPQVLPKKDESEEDEKKELMQMIVIPVPKKMQEEEDEKDENKAAVLEKSDCLVCHYFDDPVNNIRGYSIGINDYEGNAEVHDISGTDISFDDIKASMGSIVRQLSEKRATADPESRQSDQELLGEAKSQIESKFPGKKTYDNWDDFHEAKRNDNAAESSVTPASP